MTTVDAALPASAQSAVRERAAPEPTDVAGIRVLRGGRVEPLLHTHPILSSERVNWQGVAVEGHSSPACVVPRHEHMEDFLHAILHGSTRYEVHTRGKTFRLSAGAGTTFILPRGTIDELRWDGPTQRIAVSIHPGLLANALDETAHESDIELIEHWSLTDPHIMAVLLAMKTDLDAGSPAGRLYGESLANSLAVYLLSRYTVRNRAPVPYRGGLPRHRLNRVLDYIAENLAEDLTLSQLAGLCGMSPHYFSELFRQSIGRAPHQYILQQRIERAKQNLRDPRRSIIEAGLEAGFQNPSHFSRVFRRYVGTTPSRFQSETRGI